MSAFRYWYHLKFGGDSIWFLPAIVRIERRHGETTTAIRPNQADDLVHALEARNYERQSHQAQHKRAEIHSPLRPDQDGRVSERACDSECDEHPCQIGESLHCGYWYRLIGPHISKKLSLNRVTGRNSLRP